MKTSLALFGLALICGAILRVYHLDRNPQGVHPDEALYAYEGWSIQTTGCDYRQTGCPPLYLKGYSTVWDNRTSVLYPYMYSILWRILPMTTEVIRLPSVLFGMGVIVLTFLLAWRLFATRPLVAGVASLLVALSPMAVSWSRVGHDPITVPFLTLLIAYSLLRTPEQPRWWLVAGLALAVGMYSYQPFKFVGVSVAAISIWYIRPRWISSQRRWIVTTAVMSMATVLPFLINQIEHWNVVQRQFNGINLLGSDMGWLRVFWNVDQYIFALISRPNISLVFVPLFCVVGLFLLWKPQRRVFIYFFLWFFLALVPVFITYWRFAANEMQSRGLGITGPLEIMAALGIVWLYERWMKYAHQITRVVTVSALMVVLLGLVVFSGLTNRTNGGFCCFVLGGMEQVASIVQQPNYINRPIIIDRFHFMQGVNMLWNMKVPPHKVQVAPTAHWEHWDDNQLTPTEILATIDRYRLCHVEDCFRPGDGALYVVPVDALPNLPTVATFDLWFFRDAHAWKIVDNSLTK